MSRIKLVMLSMMSVIVASAVMGSSAAAVGPSCGSAEGKDTVICIENATEKLEFEGLMGTSDEVAAVSLLKSKLLGLAAKIECKKILGIGIIEDSGKIKVKATLQECKMLEPKVCKLSAVDEKEIVAEVTGEVVEGTTKGQVKFTGSNAEETITQIEVEGCTKTTLKVKGKQTCETEGSPDAATEEKSGVCMPSGGELKLGAEKAEMEVKVPGIEIIDKLVGKTVDSELEGLKWWFGKS
jgi:hypothetical protein